MWAWAWSVLDIVHLVAHQLLFRLSGALPSVATTMNKELPERGTPIANNSMGTPR